MTEMLTRTVMSFLSSLTSWEAFALSAGLLLGALRGGGDGIGTEEDAQFVARVKDGDRDAYAYLFKKYSDTIYRYCYFFLYRRREPEEDAKTATAEAFRRCFEKIYTLKDDSAFYYFLKTTAANICKDILTDTQALPETEEGSDPIDALTREETPDSPTLISRRPDPEDEVGELELKEALMRALGDLPEHYSRAFILVRVMGYTHEEAAGLMNAKVPDVKNWVHRGLEKLRIALQEYRGTTS